ITPGLGTRWVLCPMGHAVWSMRPWARKFLSDRVEELRAVTVDLVPSGKAPEVDAIGDVEAPARVRPPPRTLNRSRNRDSADRPEELPGSESRTSQRCAQPRPF